MASWNKQLTKYTKTYIKRLERANFQEEDLLICKTITLLTLNTMIYFVEALKESNPSYSGIKPKQWALELKKANEENIHAIYEAITLEYFDETIEDGISLKNFDVVSFRDTFKVFITIPAEEHLVDVVFRNLYLDAVKRNEMPVMTFVQLVSSSFQRMDAMIEKNLEELHNRKEK